jgi:hypothetical protein
MKIGPEMRMAVDGAPYIDLQATINRFVKEHNHEPKPFIWRADPDEIIAAVQRGHQALESIHSHVRHYKMQEQPGALPFVWTK